MILALALAANAAELPTDAEVAAKHPYGLEVAGDGKKLHIRDLDNRALPTRDALVLVGLPDAAAAYREAEDRRKAVSLGLWIGGGALILAGNAVTLAQGGLEAGPSVAVTYAGVAAVGAGFPVRFVRPRQHLGAWADEATVLAAVDAHNASQSAPEASPVAVGARQAALERRLLYIDYDGTVVDEDRNPVRMAELLRAIDDADTEEAWKRARSTDKAIWITTLSVGGGLTVVGAITAFGGVLISWLGGESDLVGIGAGMATLGLVGVGTGVTGMVVSWSRHNDPTFWYDEPTLRLLLADHERDLRRDLGLLPTQGAWNLEVRPVVGPGLVGLTGTF